RINADVAGGTGPACQHFDLDVTVIGAETPIGPALENRKAGTAKSLRRDLRCVGTERRSKPLISALMAIDRVDDLRIVTSLRRQSNNAVVAQRRIKRARQMNHGCHETFEPSARYQIEQCRGSHKIARTERLLEIAGKIGRDRGNTCPGGRCYPRRVK